MWLSTAFVGKPDDLSSGRSRLALTVTIVSCNRCFHSGVQVVKVRFRPAEVSCSRHAATGTGGNRIASEGCRERAGPTPWCSFKRTGRPSRNRPLAGWLTLAEDHTKSRWPQESSDSLTSS